jgi:hypothetical protein
MISKDIAILDPGTGARIGICHGPTASGTCPFARRNGIVPCAGRLIAPPGADHRFWPLAVPPDHRYCELGWNALAVACLAEAEDCRAKWRAGADSETRRVLARAAKGDPRYRKMTPAQLKTTGLWRWRLSTSAVQLRKAEDKQRERARAYLGFSEFRRLSTLQLSWTGPKSLAAGRQQDHRGQRRGGDS